MRTTIALSGLAEIILEKAVELGLARSKTDALRLGIFELNKEYHIVSDVGTELLERRLMMAEAEAKRKGTRFIPKDEALAKYR